MAVAIESLGETTYLRHDLDRPTPWWRGAVIYQVYPRSFQDSSGSGVGDLQGITARLDYIASLGVDAIWLSPFFQSPMKDMGYDVSDYRQVDPLFGSLDDFDLLLERAHALGLKVIIDQVLSHTSDQHAWFQESRSSRDNAKADWYVWADPKADGSPPNNWQSVFMGPSWTWDTRRRQYYLHNFLSSQPDLNLHNQQVQEAVLDAARFWLDRGVDGFRLDALNFSMHDPDLADNPPMGGMHYAKPFDFQCHVKNQSHTAIPMFLEKVRALIDDYPDRFTVAEVGGLDPLPEMKSFTEGTKRLHSAYNFDFLTNERITAQHVRAVLENWPDQPDTGWPSFAFSNHDARRAVSRWETSDDLGARARLQMALLLSLRGNAFVYQGEELGLPQAHIPFDRLTDPEAIANWPETLGRDGARTPMPWTKRQKYAGFSKREPWLPIIEDHKQLAVDVQEKNPHSTLAMTRKLLALRQATPALRQGSIHFWDDIAEGLLVIERRCSSQRVLCVFNLTPDPITWHAWDMSAWAFHFSTETGDVDGQDPIAPSSARFFIRTLNH